MFLIVYKTKEHMLFFPQRVGLTGLNGPTVIHPVLKFVFVTVTSSFRLGISVLETAVKFVPAYQTPTLSQVDTHTHTPTHLK